jgi:hypothetical protein
MSVAWIDFTPGIDDGDDGLANEILSAVSELLHARAMPEPTHARRSEPAETSESFRSFVHFAPNQHTS